MTEIISAEEAARRFDALAKSFMPRLEEPLGQVMVDAVEDARRNFEGMSLFQKKGPTAPALILYPKEIRQVGGELEASIVVGGIAALIETGRPTARHTILPTGNYLRFQGATGTVFARAVEHPGSHFPRENATERAAAAAERGAGPALDRAAQETINRVGLG